MQEDAGLVGTRLRPIVPASCCILNPDSGILIEQVSSSIGRASVSKTEGWGFESLLTCQPSLTHDSRSVSFGQAGSAAKAVSPKHRRCEGGLDAGELKRRAEIRQAV